MNTATRDQAEDFFHILADRMTALYAQRSTLDPLTITKAVEEFCTANNVHFERLTLKPFEAFYKINSELIACRVSRGMVTWYSFTPNEVPPVPVETPRRVASITGDEPADVLRAKTDKKWKAYRPQIKGKLLKGIALSNGEQAMLDDLTVDQLEAFNAMITAAKAALAA